MSIELMLPYNHFVFCCPLLFLPLIFPSIRVFSVLCIRCRKYWSFSFNIRPSSEYSGLISFRMDWLDLLAVQETLKSLLQHHSSKASILWCSAFFMVQLSHPHMPTGKTMALTIWTFVGKVMLSQPREWTQVSRTVGILYHLSLQGSHRTLQWVPFPSLGIFLIRESNQGLLHCRQIR